MLQITRTHSEKELFRQLSEGDAHAYTEIFHLYFDVLFRNAVKVLKSEFWAEEVVQDVFLQLWVNRDTVQQIESPAAYLFKVTIHRCFDRIRRQELEAKAQYLVNQVLHGPPDVYQQDRYDLDLLKKQIRSAIDQLPLQQRQVFLLQKEKGISYDEIATELGISKNTVRNHMVKALQSIRSQLQARKDIFLLVLSVCGCLGKIR